MQAVLGDLRVTPEEVSRPDGAEIKKVVLGILCRDREQLARAVGWPALLNARSDLGMTPLFAAAYALWVDGVRELVRAGADVGEATGALVLSSCDSPPTRQRDADFEEIVSIILGAGRRLHVV